MPVLAYLHLLSGSSIHRCAQIWPLHMQPELCVSGAAVCARTAQEAAARPSVKFAHEFAQRPRPVRQTAAYDCTSPRSGAAGATGNRSEPPRQGIQCTRRTRTGQDTTFSTCHQLSCIRSDPLTAIPSSPRHRRRRLVLGDCYTACFHPLLDLPRLKMSAPCGNTD